MIAGIVLRREVLRVLRIAHRFIEVGNTVEDGAGTNPLIHRVANLVAGLRIVSATFIWRQCCANHLDAVLMGRRRKLRDACLQALR